MTPWIILSSCAGFALILSVLLEHRRKVRAIAMHYSTPDYQRGLIDGLKQASSIVHNQGWCYDSDRARARNAIVGASEAVERVR